MGNKNNNCVFLFGEAEKCDYCTPLRFNTLIKLSETLGNPPEDSSGIDYAVQLLLFNRELIYFRVSEEGFSKEDYLRGAKILHRCGDTLKPRAICIPGVGDPEIIETISSVSRKLHSLLILTERDFFDYLTGSKY